jgi:hypothetical protein
MTLEQTRSRPSFARCALALSACAALGCLDRPDVEPVGYSAYVLEPSAEVRPLERNLDASKKLDANDGLTSPVPLRAGFVDGSRASYWDLGQSPMSAEPMWVLVDGPLGHEALVDGHPPIIDSIPGDMAYSPIRIVFDVHVTDKYRGERIPSLRAIEDAVELGLLLDPEISDFFVNCAVTLQDVEFEQGSDLPNLRPTSAFYRDREVFHFCARDFDDPSSGDMTMFPMSMFPLKQDMVFFGNAYSLRRENSVALLDEVAMKRDLDADGDMLDVNVIFDSQPGMETYSSLWKSIEVVVDPSYTFGQASGFDQLFQKQPGGMAATDLVIEYRDTTMIVNRPIRGVVP